MPIKAMCVISKPSMKIKLFVIWKRSNWSQTSSSMALQTLCIISQPSVNSNWSYVLKMLNPGHNCRFFGLCNFEIWQTTTRNNRTHLPYHFKFCTSFRSHLWIQIGVTTGKRYIRVKILTFFSPCAPEIWRMILKNNRVTLLCHSDLCALFHGLLWIQTWVTVQKRSTWVTNRRLCGLCDLEIWRMNSKNNSAPLLCPFKLCAKFCSHLSIQIGVRVRKRQNWGEFCFDLCDLDL